MIFFVPDPHQVTGLVEQCDENIRLAPALVMNDELVSGWITDDVPEFSGPESGLSTDGVFDKFDMHHRWYMTPHKNLMAQNGRNGAFDFFIGYNRGRIDNIEGDTHPPILPQMDVFDTGTSVLKSFSGATSCENLRLWLAMGRCR